MQNSNKVGRSSYIYGVTIMVTNIMSEEITQTKMRLNGIKRVLFVTQDVEEIGCEGEYMGQS